MNHTGKIKGLLMLIALGAGLPTITSAQNWNVEYDFGNTINGLDGTNSIASPTGTLSGSIYTSLNHNITGGSGGSNLPNMSASQISLGSGLTSFSSTSQDFVTDPEFMSSGWDGVGNEWYTFTLTANSVYKLNATGFSAYWGYNDGGSDPNIAELPDQGPDNDVWTLEVSVNGGAFTPLFSNMTPTPEATGANVGGSPLSINIPNADSIAWRFSARDPESVGVALKGIYANGTVTAVPEAGSAGLALLAGSSMLLRRRRI